MLFALFMRNLSSGPCFGYKVYGIGFVLFPQITKHLLQRSFFLLTSYLFAGEKMGIYAGCLKKDGKLVYCAIKRNKNSARTFRLPRPARAFPISSLLQSVSANERGEMTN